ncbi:MAG: hypothetical protein IT169_14215 [Bryobacterales bacterium]|nr:hypothetical protein [Bryobacterales bacterium]
MTVVPHHSERRDHCREAPDQAECKSDTAPESLDPDEVLFPDPFREPADFAPIPAPQARLSDVLELAGHIAFVLLVTVVIPLTMLWAVYRLYRWLPFETMALAVVSAAALWSYRDRLGPLLRRLLLGAKPR